MNGTPAGRGPIPAALALVAALVASAGHAEPQSSVVPLLDGAEHAAATVVGTLETPQRLDTHGYAAVLVVERALTGSLAPDARQRIAWEEFATSRPPRFAAGERILVALEPLPRTSLWQARLPEGEALAVAASGRAAWKAPDAATVASLERYLRLAPAERASAAGAAALLGVAADAAPAIAESALAALGARPELEAQLAGASGANARAQYARLVADGARPQALREAAVALAGTHGLVSLRPAIEPLAKAGEPLEAAAWEALGRMDGALPPGTAQALLARDEASLREVAVRFGGDAIADDRLAAAASGDPAPGVRTAAVEMLLERRGAAALDTAIPLLFDRDAAVAREAAVHIARLGAVAVPRLRETFADHPYGEISELSPVALALATSGPAGAAALEQISEQHPDAARRRLAGLALGRLGDPH